MRLYYEAIEQRVSTDIQRTFLRRLLVSKNDVFVGP
jgi:hypothetical protein